MRNKSIRSLIQEIKTAVAHNKLTNSAIADAIKELESLGHSTYDNNKFPLLENTNSFDVSVGSTPASLAEALLWKLGKWPTYKTFVENYKNKELEVSTTGGIVFSAFAKHLQNNEYPIYDQHSIRAIWAICELQIDEQEFCQSLLFDKSGAWKQAGSGDDGSCYKLFITWVKKICHENGVSHRELDQLLMPLGQAIKKETRSKKTDNDSKSDLQRFIALSEVVE